MTGRAIGPANGARRRVGPWAVLTALAALVAGAGWLGASQSVVRHTPGALPAQVVVTADHCNLPTKFAGYFASGPVDQIGAQWVVPRIERATSVYQSAATWLGASSPAGAFIQLGTWDAVGNLAPSPQVRYKAFWSDTAKNDRAEPLFGVSPGDVVAASMRRTQPGWRLAFRDVTTGRSTSFTVDYAPRARFTQPQWAQEDVSGHCTLGAYPVTTAVAMRNLRLNGRPPRLRYRDAAVMETSNGTILLPTKVRDDGFALVAPRGLGARFLGATAPLDIAVERFLAAVGQARLDAVLTHQTALVQRGARLQALTTAEGALATARRTRHALASLRLPAADGRIRARLEARLVALISSIRSAATRFRHAGSWTLGAVLRQDGQLDRAADRLSKVLGLPPG